MDLLKDEIKRGWVQIELSSISDYGPQISSVDH